MKKTLPIIVLLLTVSTLNAQEKWGIIVHGGAGNITPQNLQGPDSLKYKSALDSALSIGSSILKNGGNCEDAVTKVICYLEDNPLFNAGKGSVFTSEGKNELDACIMKGETLESGAVAGVGDIKNPILAARAVMEKSSSVLLTGIGASRFARTAGLEMVDSSYFFTKKSWESLQKAKTAEIKEKHGTVGCVALDIHGNLAAATSTGGMTNKRPGRIGDSPIVGAGTYADNRSCAISCTGHGEFFIRYTVARSVAALVEYRAMDLDEAVRQILWETLDPVGGKGGIIAIDRNGNMVMDFNTPGMFRGYQSFNGKKIIELFKP